MKTSKSGNLLRPIALFLVAAALIGTIGFAANGWQSITQPENNSGNVENNNNNTDNNKDDSENEPVEEPIYIPKYVSYLTGLEITEAEYFTKPVCFVMNPKGPVYGISSAEAIIEIPTESGTRILTYMNSKKLPGKIGTVTETRKYIDNLIKYFGGVLVSNGNDDTVVYNGFDIAPSKFDLTEKSGYHYTEYTHYVYTNGDLITAGIVNSGIASYTGAKENMPYKFVDFGADAFYGTEDASSVSLIYSQDNKTEFVYSKISDKYTLSKSGEIKKDLINDKTAEFDNVFVLFADATTYETASASEMVLDTISGGVGKYISKGKAVDISWATDADGNLIFTNQDNEILTVNRGTSYIGFMKSSRTVDLVITK